MSANRPFILTAFALAISIASVAPARAATDTAPLVSAAQTRDREAVIALLKSRKLDVDQQAFDGTTALHWAVHFNDADLVARLLKAKADPNVTNEFGATPLSEAAIVGNVEIIERLLKAGADVESANAEGQTALMIIARTNNIAAAKMLLKHGANPNAVEQWRGQTALMWASAQQQPAMVELLLEHGADPNARSRPNDWQRQVTAEPRAKALPTGGMTPLMYAARQGCVACADALLAAGAEINKADPDAVTALLVATLSANWDTAKLLVARGANVNKWDWWGRTPLYAAVDYHTIPHGGRPDRPSMDTTTSLQLIELLLGAGANPNAQLKLLQPYRALGADRGADAILGLGTTPLVRAAKAGDTPVVKLLLEHGALPDLPTATGVTPLMAAAGVGYSPIDTRGRFVTEQDAIESARLLIAAGAHIDAQERRGLTALHGAAFRGWNGFVQFLADNHANLEARNVDGMTALDAAMGRVSAGRGNQGVVQEATARLLTELMAIPSGATR